MSISLPQGLALGTALIGVGAMFSETVSGGEEVKPLSASADAPKLTYNNEITR